MRIIEHLSSLSPAMRELLALRWGVPAGSPRVMAEALFSESVRAQLFERIASDGAAPLYERLICAAGVAVPVPRGMEEMAGWLEARGLLLLEGTGVMLPVELALLEQERAPVEEGWLLTLLARCSEANLRSIGAALGLTLPTRRVELLLTIGRALPAAGRSKRSASEPFVPVPAGELVSVEATLRAGRLAFAVETRSDRREVEAQTQVAAPSAAASKRRAVEPVSPFSFPRHGAVGAVLVASTPAYARYLTSQSALAGYLGEQLDACRFATPAEVSFEELRSRLVALLSEDEVLHGR